MNELIIEFTEQTCKKYEVKVKAGVWEQVMVNLLSNFIN